VCVCVCVCMCVCVRVCVCMCVLFSSFCYEVRHLAAVVHAHSATALVAAIITEQILQCDPLVLVKGCEGSRAGGHDCVVV
jgi:hypothetical protein